VAGLSSAVRSGIRRLIAHRTLLFLVTAGLFFALAADQVRRMGDFRVDDAYITFSFSKNLALGRGPVYSHDLRVEGYSNFLWMVLVGVFHKLGFELYLGARVLSGLCLAGCGYAVYSLVRRTGVRSAAVLGVLWLVCCSDMVRAALSGLETVAVSAALALAYSAYLRETPQQLHWSLLWLIPVVLLRIDGFVPAAILLGIEGCASLVERRFSLQRLVVVALPILGTVLIYHAWRYGYYGLPLSSTYYAKSMVAAQDPGRGSRQLVEWVHDYGLWYLIPFVIAALFGVHRRRALILLGAVLAHAAYVVRVGGDWMPFSRFFLPTAPLLAMLVGLGVASLWSKPNLLKAQSTPLVIFLKKTTYPLRVVLAVGLWGFSASRVHMAIVESSEESAKLGHAEHVKRHTLQNLLGSVDLAQHVIRKPGERLVSDYAGIFAVFTEANIIDMWGLANPQIARFGGIEGINSIYGKECAACYPSLNPDYFHVVVPLIRKTSAFRSKRAVIRDVFQSGAISRYLDLKKHFVAGYVHELSSDRAFWFLERRRDGIELVTRRPAPGIEIVYPFED
jgi:hypothetical protein